MNRQHETLRKNIRKVAKEIWDTITDGAYPLASRTWVVKGVSRLPDPLDKFLAWMQRIEQLTERPSLQGMPAGQADALETELQRAHTDVLVAKNRGSTQDQLANYILGNYPADQLGRRTQTMLPPTNQQMPPPPPPQHHQPGPSNPGHVHLPPMSLPPDLAWEEEQQRRAGYGPHNLAKKSGENIGYGAAWTARKEAIYGRRTSGW